MFRLLSSLLLLVPVLAFGQVHVVQPFKYYFDEQTVNVNGTAGQQQVDHFEIQIDATSYNGIGLPLVGPSTVAGFTTFALQSSLSLVTGNHTFSVRACSSTGSTSCAASSAFAFILDAALIPIPAPTNQRVGP